MHYYSHHIGDYRSNTAHLSNEEDLAYRRLLEMYYDTEQPIPLETQWVARRLRVAVEALQSVLEDFFLLTDGGWTHQRCDREIAAHHSAKGRHWGASLTREQRNATQAERNASKVNATPRWLTKEQRKQIESIYAQAIELSEKTGIKHEVDHIVPLRSKVVCGLHVAWNLRAIPAHKNRVKSNNF